MDNSKLLRYPVYRSLLGFTLAEVLITLGIIGVVAAVTVPTLMQNHQRKVYVTQLQKAYTELQQALQRKINDSNAINAREAGLTLDKTFTKQKDFLHTYFKVAKDCGTDLTPCFASEYTNDLGAYPHNLGNGILPIRSLLGKSYNISLASGAAIAIGEDFYGIVIDINGAQGPNIYCRDLFSFKFHQTDVNEIRSDCVTRLIEKGWTMDEDYDSDPTGTK